MSAAGRWALVEGPLAEPLTVADAKAHARITHAVEDGLILSYIKTAREAAEEYMSRGLLTQSWQLVLDDFAESIYLPRAAPLQSVAVEYYDADGLLTVLDPSRYDVDLVARPGRVTRAAGQTWPTLASERLAGRVVITYVIGWETRAEVPELIKQGLRLFVAYLDADRSGQETYGAACREAAQACWQDGARWIEPGD